MKERTCNYILALFVFFLADLLCFVLQPYPRAIVQAALNASYNFSSSVTGLLFHLLYFFLLYKTVQSLSYDEKKECTFKRICLYIGALLLSQIAMDFLRIILLSRFSIYQYLIDDIYTIVSWLAFAEVTQGFFHPWQRNRKIRFGIALLYAFILLIAVCFDLKALEEKQYYLKKFYQDSEEFITRSMNSEFRHEIRNVILDFLGAVVLISSFFVSDKKTGNSSRRNKSILFMRMMVAVSALLTVILAKQLIVPQASIALGQIQQQSVINSYFADQNRFSVDSTVTTISRFTDNRSLSPVFQNTNCEIWYADKKIASFQKDGRYTGLKGGAEKSIITIGNDWAENGTGDIAAFAGEVIVLKSKNDFLVIHADQLSQYTNNRIDEFIIETIQKSDWTFYEYSLQQERLRASPLLRPIIERYSHGDFTTEEKQENESIDPQFIQTISAKALE